jgi:Flp pilus assembly CpaF family ATPase
MGLRRQGAGKTTLLRALINSIPLNERFGTLKQTTN